MRLFAQIYEIICPDLRDYLPRFMKLFAQIYEVVYPKLGTYRK
jgi:hypothetical protein